MARSKQLTGFEFIFMPRLHSPNNLHLQLEVTLLLWIILILFEIHSFNCANRFTIFFSELMCRVIIVTKKLAVV